MIAEKENRSFEPCPPAVLQWRNGGFRDGQVGMLWRTSHCNYDRWHYWENPCNCYATGRPTAWEIIWGEGYAPVHVEPITGTWRRDGRYIDTVKRSFREQLRQRRELEIAASATRGPQPIKKPVTFCVDFETSFCCMCNQRKPCSATIGVDL